MLSHQQIVLVIALIAAASFFTPCDGAKIIRAGSKDWSAVDWMKLEEDWKDGDDEEILKGEDEVLYEEIERRKLTNEKVARSKKSKSPASSDPNADLAKLKKMTPEQVRKMAKRNGGTIVGDGNGLGEGMGMDDTKPVMMFVELVSTPPPSVMKYSDGPRDGWDKQLVTILSTMYKDLLQTGGLTVQIYAIEESKLLVSCQKGWLGNEIMDFFLGRKGEVLSVTIDGVETKA